jgi:hypothetical protein
MAIGGWTMPAASPGSASRENEPPPHGFSHPAPWGGRPRWSVQVWPGAGALGIRLPAAPADELERAVPQHGHWIILLHEPGSSALSSTPALAARRYWLMYIL